MTAPDAAAWANALTMYERRYSIVAVGPRRHEDWVLDAAALLRKETKDPRSWKPREFYEGDEAWSPERLVPFPPAGLGWRSRLREIARFSAAQLLVAISTNWLDVTKEPDFEDRRLDLEEKARTLLARFPPPTTQFFTNGWCGPGDPQDFYNPITGCDPFSEHDWDVGLLAVSESELGIFWSFDAT
ncbi:hypothetical protein ACFPH6_36870 [Streptomyces xiangluensis]|uniref:DUF4253 domain-containing protein n=1 Tax=Streptomyces xiangluensis TaxID=2665720 RepID=A0ABV8YZA8_9ACTN